MVGSQKIMSQVHVLEGSKVHNFGGSNVHTDINFKESIAPNALPNYVNRGTKQLNRDLKAIN